MSLNVTKMRQKARLLYIQDHVLFKTYDEMSKDCGVDKRTIIRDVKRWQETGGFDAFLTKEFFQLYGIERHTNPSKALDKIIFLMSRRMDQKQEQTGLIQSVKVVAPWDNKFNNSSLPTTMYPTADSNSSTTAPQGSESSPVADAGEKTIAPSTKPSNSASQAGP